MRYPRTVPLVTLLFAALTSATPAPIFTAGHWDSNRAEENHWGVNLSSPALEFIEESIVFFGSAAGDEMVILLPPTDIGLTKQDMMRKLLDGTARVDLHLSTPVWPGESALRAEARLSLDGEHWSPWRRMNPFFYDASVPGGSCTAPRGNFTERFSVPFTINSALRATWLAHHTPFQSVVQCRLIGGDVREPFTIERMALRVSTLLSGLRP